jgi:putative cell wall-binding protein
MSRLLRRPVLMLAALSVAAVLLPAGAGASDAVSAAGVRSIAPAADVVAQGIQISQEAFPRDGTAAHVVLSRDDIFADSLAGTALAGDRGPILFTGGGAGKALATATGQELRRVLPAGGMVYVLGGTAAVSEEAAQGVRRLGYAVERLDGLTRFETAVAIARAAAPAADHVLLARGDDWADAVTGGAFAADRGVPIIVTPRTSLHPAAQEYLRQRRPGKVTLLGGEAALSKPVADAASAAAGTAVGRVAGEDRAETAARIARSLWGRSAGQAGDAFVIVEGRAASSWAPALAAGVVSARRDAPQLLAFGSHRVLPLATHAYLRDLDYRRGAGGSATTVGPLVTDAHRTLLREVLNDGRSAQTVPGASGRLSSDGYKPGDGFKLFVRYIGPFKQHYVGYVNTRDELYRIYKKPSGQREDDYVQLCTARDKPYRTPWGKRQEARLSAVDNADGSVTLRLVVGGATVCEVTDRSSPITGAHHVGMRADNMEFFVDDFLVHAATAKGEPTGDPLLRDRFSYPDGLLTNQRDRSARSAVWNVTSGSLSVRGGRAWSGAPDDVYPDPESAAGNGTAKFRAHTKRADFRNVVVSVSLWNQGFVPHTDLLATPARLSHPRYPAAPFPAVRSQRMYGRSKVHTAIEVSKRAFGSSRAVVLTNADVRAGTLAAPALAGKLGGPLLLTGSTSLHADTATEIRRLKAREAWLVGPLNSSLDSQLRSAGITTIRRLSGANDPAVAAAVAGSVRGSRAYLAVAEDWSYATSISGASARLHRPVLLTGRTALPAVTERALRDLKITHVTVLGTDIDPRIVDRLRQHHTVVYGGFSRYSIARVSAQHQIAGKATSARIWLAAGSRPSDTLVGGAAAAKEGGTLVSLDGASLADWDRLHDVVSAPGFEALHWTRYERPKLGFLRVIGDTASVSNTVVSRLTATR